MDRALCEAHKARLQAALAKFAEYGINILTLPPHTTHKTQGLDKVVFGPLKRRYGEDMAYLLLKKQPCSLYNFPQQVWACILSMCTVELIKKSFEAVGLWPINPDKVQTSLQDVICEDEIIKLDVGDKSMDQILASSIEGSQDAIRALVDDRERALQVRIERLKGEFVLQNLRHAEEKAAFVEAINVDKRKQLAKQSELFLAREHRQRVRQAEIEATAARNGPKTALLPSKGKLKRNDGVTAKLPKKNQLLMF